MAQSIEELAGLNPWRCDQIHHRVGFFVDRALRP
jgi:hypothetical protein